MLKKGIYEQIISKDIKSQMEKTKLNEMVCLCKSIDVAESPQLLANYLAKAIRQKLEETENQHDRVNLINNILLQAGVIEDMKIVESNDLLSEVMTNQQYTLQSQSNTKTVRPISGFRVSNLFTGGNSTLSLGEEIRREIG